MTKAAALAAFSAICLANTDATATVINGGRSTTGFTGTLSGSAEQSAYGQRGPQDGTVWCSADAIGTVELDAEISISGVGVNVTGTAIDPLGALVRINYRRTRPVTAETI